MIDYLTVFALLILLIVLAMPTILQLTAILQTDDAAAKRPDKVPSSFTMAASKTVHSFGGQSVNS